MALSKLAWLRYSRTCVLTVNTRRDSEYTIDQHLAYPVCNYTTHRYSM
jgi:hypothetical protein